MGTEDDGGRGSCPCHPQVVGQWCCVQRDSRAGGGCGSAPWGTEQVTLAHGPGEHGGLPGGQEVLGR